MSRQLHRVASGQENDVCLCGGGGGGGHNLFHHKIIAKKLNFSFLQTFIHFKVLRLSILLSLWEHTHTHACTHTHAVAMSAVCLEVLIPTTPGTVRMHNCNPFAIHVDTAENYFL